MSSEICALPNAVLEAGFCAYELPIQVNKPRSVLSIGTTEILALERGTSSVIHLFDSDDDGIPDMKRTVVTGNTLNHGLALHEGYLYASSDTTVYRWSYEGDDFTSMGEEEIFVNNINENGMGGAPEGHRTRTMAFDELGRLYISVGSGGNVDVDSYRSRIRRFDLDTEMSPIDFQAGEVFADGLRNEVGLAFDKHGVLWGVENSADRLSRDNMGGDIHNDNPAEELNRFREEDAGKHWGYPYCWTEFNLPQGVGLGPGTAWAWPTFLNAGDITDEQCQADYLPPEVAMQAHSAPLGITFYEWKSPADLPVECDKSPFPETMDGYAFVAFHGSWNRDVPTGYKVVYIAMDVDGDALSGPIDLLAHEPPNAQWEDGFRPVDVDFDACGRLIVSSDGTGPDGSKIVRIIYSGDDMSPSPTGESDPSTMPSTQDNEKVTPSPSPAEEPATTTMPSTQDPCPCLTTGSPVPEDSSSSPYKRLFIFAGIVVCSMLFSL